MDIIRICNIAYSGIHGILAVEQKRAQEFKTTVELHLDASKAATSDDIDDAVDYRVIREVVREVIEGPSKHLLEHLATQMAEKVMQDSRIALCKVSICKTQIWDNGAPEVTIIKTATR